MNSIKEAFKKAKYNRKPICPYCGKPAELVKGNAIYPHRQDLFDLNFWSCKPCGAYVGCHKPNPSLGLTGTEALGRLADEDLRYAKSEAHAAFDPIWKQGLKTRLEAYSWLAKQLGIAVADCHIGEFDVQTCEKVEKIAERFFEELS